jgi:hypothetical protein
MRKHRLHSQLILARTSGSTNSAFSGSWLGLHALVPSRLIFALSAAQHDHWAANACPYCTFHDQRHGIASCRFESADIYPLIRISFQPLYARFGANNASATSALSREFINVQVSSRRSSCHHKLERKKRQSPFSSLSPQLPLRPQTVRPMSAMYTRHSLASQKYVDHNPVHNFHIHGRSVSAQVF